MSITRAQKLAALARDSGATPAERALAAKFLAALPPEQSPKVQLGLRESWERALLQSLAARHGGQIEFRMNSAVVESEKLDELLVDLAKLHPALEDMVISATAGFLASQFPPVPGATSGQTKRSSDAVILAAFREGQHAVPKPEPKKLSG